MKYIDENKIQELLNSAGKAGEDKIDAILDKSRSLKRLTLDETAALLAVNDPRLVKKIFEAAAYVKNAIYGNRVVLFAPLYISNFCANKCVYCAFQSGNPELKRKYLNAAEIREQVEWLLKRGHKRILVVAGESGVPGKSAIEYYTEAVEAAYSARVGQHYIKRVNINCAPLSIEDFKKLKAANIGTFQLFQETYHDETYRKCHLKGPKSDPDNRLDAIDRAFAAGIDDVGIGPLYGLYDYRFETLAMMMHIEHLEKKFNVGPHTISVPRIEPAVGSEFSLHPPYQVSDDDFKKLVAIIRLSVPYTGMILTTRETAQMRDEVISLGISQISAGSKTSPGGYSDSEKWDGQFATSDKRSLEELVGMLIEKNYIPSFCAACYRRERTGESFMSLAKPGLIKGMCSVNALVTFKEYLDDFASPQIKREGYKLIERETAKLDENSRGQISKLFAAVDSGLRDEYV
ncbi:MAG: [FeFe] hydrogenase H-cluster radical SAM maturase HydG [Candidatus Omnitrophica bacterium]|nr:[FeFe] hydrogenase H-cluster radical SAM maturase HydG [Candidatus Omnitrophota bacterium]MDD5546144.1 [FeFe] hydrogenase H-cluster radical SAM maturase HydG [Candidatus Omnitrophota bacterium]